MSSIIKNGQTFGNWKDSGDYWWPRKRQYFMLKNVHSASSVYRIAGNFCQGYFH